uniref:Spermatogenesis-associated protein 48 n=1 Tax=Geotrypetes seraphini TaxID=260995 RepID=A0A6P8QHY4_GEOSA|nr:spermatogenesis-associated protein 48 [Geotrypetes seraphini]
MPERRRLSMAEPPLLLQKKPPPPPPPPPRFYLQQLGAGTGGSHALRGTAVRVPYTSADAELLTGRQMATNGWIKSRWALAHPAPPQPAHFVLLPEGREEPPLQQLGGREEPLHCEHFHHHHHGAYNWNSKVVSERAHRAQLGGWTSPVKVIPALTSRGQKPNLTQTFAFKMEPTFQHSDDTYSVNQREEAARKFMYTSSTQSNYEEVSWDTKLPPKMLPPDSTLEQMADPVSRHLTWKRYVMEPAIWQSVGGIWDRFQTRPFHVDGRPVTFVSPCQRIYQIPLYSGCIGAENLEDIDNPSANFVPITVLRTPQPQPSTHNGNIPGYTGKIQWTLSHPPSSYIPSSLVNNGMRAQVLSK